MRRDDRGEITLLVIGLAFIAMLVVVVTVDASAVFLARRSLTSAVDGAALAAAQGLDEQQFYAGPAGDVLPLTDVEAAVAAYQRTRFPDLELVGELVNGGSAVLVRGRQRVSLPLARMFGFDQVTVEATALARIRSR